MAIINLDKTKSTMHIYSVKAHKELANGNVIGVDTLAVGVAGISEGEVFNAVAPAKGGKKRLVAGVPLMADERLLEADFKVAKNELVRALELEAGDIIGITVDGIDLNSLSPTVGQVLVVEPGKEMLKLKATAESGDEVYGQVIEVGNLAFQQAIWFLV